DVNVSAHFSESGLVHPPRLTLTLFPHSASMRGRRGKAFRAVLSVRAASGFGFRSSSLNHSRPGFFPARLELRGEVLPFDFEVFVAPGNFNVARFKVGAVLAHPRDVQGESAAHFFGHGLLDLL